MGTCLLRQKSPYGMGVISPSHVPIEMRLFIDTMKYFYREPFIFSSPVLSKSTLFTLFSYMWVELSFLRINTHIACCEACWVWENVCFTLFSFSEQFSEVYHRKRDFYRSNKSLLFEIQKKNYPWIQIQEVPLFNQKFRIQFRIPYLSPHISTTYVTKQMLE